MELKLLHVSSAQINADFVSSIQSEVLKGMFSNEIFYTASNPLKIIDLQTIINSKFSWNDSMSIVQR